MNPCHSHEITAALQRVDVMFWAFWAVAAIAAVAVIVTDYARPR